MTDSDTDIERLEQRADQFEAVADALDAAMGSLDEAASSDVVDEQTTHQIEFIKTMISYLSWQERFGDAARHTRQQIRRIESQQQLAEMNGDGE